MKIKVTDKVKGEFYIAVLKKTFRRGVEIPIGETEFFDSSIQWAIRNEYLSVIDGPVPDDTRKQGQEFRLLSKKALKIKCIDRIINSNEVFFVESSKLADSDLAVVLDKGVVIKEADFQERQSKVAQIKAVVKPSSNKEMNKKNKKTENKIAKPDKPEIVEVPDNMHIHIPETLKDEVKIKSLPRKAAEFLDLDASAQEEGDLSFVDNEQSVARAPKNIARSNDEVI